jgi:putative transposase
MPRGPRLDTEGALHHVIVRGVERSKLFRGKSDHEDFLRRITEIIPGTGASIYAWCLMPTHVHLLVRTGHGALSGFMRKLLTGYAVSFNHRHRRNGHLFQNRYKSILVEEEPYLLELVRYIHLNPLRADIVERADQLVAYQWSGHAALMGRATHSWQDCTYVLRYFGKTVRKARVAYEAFVRAGAGQGKRPDLTGGGLLRSAGGVRALRCSESSNQGWVSDERILGGSEFVRSVITKEAETKPVKRDSDVLPKLIGRIAARLSLSLLEVTSGARHHRIVEARDLISYAAVRGYGLSLADIARALEVSKQSILRGLGKGEEVLRLKGWNLADLL